MFNSELILLTVFQTITSLKKIGINGTHILVVLILTSEFKTSSVLVIKRRFDLEVNLLEYFLTSSVIVDWIIEHQKRSNQEK